MAAMLADQQSRSGGEPGFGLFGLLRDVQFAPILDLNGSFLGKPIGGSIIASFIAGGVVNKKMNMKFLNAIKQAAEQISQMNRQQLEQLAQTMRSTGNIAALTPEVAGMMSSSGISLNH
jgi:hypothetical protein